MDSIVRIIERRTENHYRHGLSRLSVGEPGAWLTPMITNDAGDVWLTEMAHSARITANDWRRPLRRRCKSLRRGPACNRRGDRRCVSPRPVGDGREQRQCRERSDNEAKTSWGGHDVISWLSGFTGFEGCRISRAMMGFVSRTSPRKSAGAGMCVSRCRDDRVLVAGDRVRPAESCFHCRNPGT